MIRSPNSPVKTWLSKAWPGAKEPGESDEGAAPSRRKTRPPGVPDPAVWGPRPDGGPDVPADSTTEEVDGE